MSVHLFRLAGRLRKHGFGVTVYDDAGAHSGEGVSPLMGRWVNRFALMARERIVHYHSHSWGIRMRLSLMSLRGKRVIFTVHSLRNMPSGFTMRRPEFRHMLSKGHFIAVNEDIAERLGNMGARNLEVIGPYISPVDWGEPHEEVRAFASFHRPVIAVSAFSFKAWERWDLYGLFSALDALALLRGEMPEAGMVIYLSQIGEEGLFGFFNERIRELGLERDVLLRLDAEEPFHTCLSVAHVFVRPTFSDSFGISIAEALEFGVPVVASDAVPRPDGVVLFRAGDPADMALAIKRALSLKPKKMSLDSFPAILDFYKRIL